MKLKITLAIGIVLAISLIAQASAVLWACFEDNEQINFCNPRVPDRTCDSSLGCTYCMSSYDPDRNCYNQGNPNACNSIPFDCQSLGGNSTNIDETPPLLKVNNPDNNAVYNKRVILLDVSLNEQSDVSYTDLAIGRWTQVCNSCSSYHGNRGFKEGLNNLMFRAIDGAENTAYVNISFLIDSKKPSISKTEPRTGFADGNFYVEFREDNPSSLILNYGNAILGYRTFSFDLNNDCTFNGFKHICEDFVALNDYSGQFITYNFELMDVAGTSVESRTRTLPVDTTFPVINSLQADVIGRYVYFALDITEQNFESAKYFDHSASRPRWIQLCTRLREAHICERRVTFTPGSHLLDIQVNDEAGNSISQQITVNV